MTGLMSLGPIRYGTGYSPVQPKRTSNVAPRFGIEAIKHNGVELNGDFVKAVFWARRIYDHKRRKDTQSPYITHYLASAASVLDDGGSQEQAIAALMQGALKHGDQTVTPDSIRNILGAKVARLVEAISEPKHAPNWHDRKYGFIATFPNVSPEARRIIAACTLQNVQSINRTLAIEGKSHWSVYKGGEGELLRYFQTASRELLRLDPQSGLTKELDRAVSKLMQLADKPSTGRTSPNKSNVMITDKYVKALGEIIEIHKEQRRKGSGAPYALHLFSVSSIVLDNGGSEDAGIAALYHDGPEDQPDKALPFLSKPPYNGRIKTMVADCTEPKDVEWQASKDAYIAHIPHVVDPESLLIIGADKLHNLRSINRGINDMGPAYWTMFTGKPERQLWFYQTVLNQLDRSPLQGRSLLDEVRHEVDTLRTYLAE